MVTAQSAVELYNLFIQTVITIKKLVDNNFR